MYIFICIFIYMLLYINSYLARQLRPKLDIALLRRNIGHLEVDRPHFSPFPLQQSVVGVELVLAIWLQYNTIGSVDDR